jgi:hypothetical protein
MSADPPPPGEGKNREKNPALGSKLTLLCDPTDASKIGMYIGPQPGIEFTPLIRAKLKLEDYSMAHRPSFLLAAALIIASTSVMQAQTGTPKEQADKAAAQEMAKAQAQKAKNDEIVAKQRAAEKAAADKAAADRAKAK